VLLITSSLFLQAGLYISEEMIFKIRHFEAMECVGGEGTFGFFISIILNLIFTIAPVGDTYDKGIKVDGKNYIDNINVYFE